MMINLLLRTSNGTASSAMTDPSPSTPMDIGVLSSPPVSDYVPSILPTIVYPTSQTVWTPQELQTLHAGLTQFSIDQFDSVTRYIKIAATLPRKCVRDVAFKVKALSRTSTKRMKIQPYNQKPHQQQQSKATVELEEARLVALLQDNVQAINMMRTNLLHGKPDENYSQMLKFRGNCETMLSALSGICTSIQPFSFQLDTSLLDEDNGDRSSNINNNQRVDIHVRSV